MKQVVITVGSLCEGVMWDRLNIAAAVSPTFMFTVAVTLLMLIASSFVTTELMMTMT